MFKKLLVIVFFLLLSSCSNQEKIEENETFSNVCPPENFTCNAF